MLGKVAVELLDLLDFDTEVAVWMFCWEVLAEVLGMVETPEQVEVRLK
tara:strand:- start:267 stop:410 length:144 start_codon:yes stop_codon:yes gene_type:complete